MRELLLTARSVEEDEETTLNPQFAGIKGARAVLEPQISGNRIMCMGKTYFFLLFSFHLSWGTRAVWKSVRGLREARGRRAGAERL